VEARLNSEKDFYVVCVAPQNETESGMDRHLNELADKYETRFIWLKEYFGESRTEELILETIAKIMQRDHMFRAG
jgi:hypothetical protein